MSFILDALKKSESDRQRQNAPDISDVPVGTSERATPRWLWLLIGLLVINLSVLVVVLLKPTQVSEPASAVPAATSAAAAPQAAVSTRQSPVDTSAQPRSEVPTRVAIEETPPDTKPATVPVISEPAVQQAAPTVTQTRLTFNDMQVSGTLNLPDLNVDIHVYSAVPADRFVFINMNQYRENTTLAEGPLVREITEEGVILEYGGAAFLLPKD
jgi:general secretion pathway protein B